MGFYEQSFIFSVLLFLLVLQDQVHCELDPVSDYVNLNNITSSTENNLTSTEALLRSSILTEKPHRVELPKSIGIGDHPGVIIDESSNSANLPGSVSFISRIGLQVAFGIVFAAGILATAATIYCLTNGIGAFFFGFFYLIFKATGIIKRVPVKPVNEEMTLEKYAIESVSEA